MKTPTNLARRLATVHLGFGLLCTLLAIPYLAAAAQTWWQSMQFADFGPYVEVLSAAARSALIKGLISAVGAVYFFWRWRELRRTH
jgi:hypothetical protein